MAASGRSRSCCSIRCSASHAASPRRCTQGSTSRPRSHSSTCAQPGCVRCSAALRWACSATSVGGLLMGTGHLAIPIAVFGGIAWYLLLLRARENARDLAHARLRRLGWRVHADAVHGRRVRRRDRRAGESAAAALRIASRGVGARGDGGDGRWMRARADHGDLHGLRDDGRLQPGPAAHDRVRDRAGHCAPVREVRTVRWLARARGEHSRTAQTARSCTACSCAT